MSYRITLNRPPVVECDTAEEVFALAALAMERQSSDEVDALALPTVSTTTEQLPQPKRLSAEPAVKSERNVTREIREYLKDAGCSKRPAQIAAALDVDVREVQSTLSAHYFEAIGRGYYRLADAEQKPSKIRASAKPAKPDPIAEAVEEFEDPAPPKRGPGRPPKAAPAQSQPADLVERIRKLMAKEGGTLQAATIALHLDASAGTVRKTMMERPDLFELTTNGGGYRLK